MPPGATKDWLSLLEEEAERRGIYVDTDIEGRIFHFYLGNDPGVLGKVRYSEEKERNYESEQGKKHIWHRYNRELEEIESEATRKVVNITLDVWDKNEFDPEEHHFIFLTESMLGQDTYSKGDQKIWIEGDGEYSGPLAEHVDDWDAIFNYGTGGSTKRTGSITKEESQNNSEFTNITISGDTSGTVHESSQTEVDVSEGFKRDAYERFNNQCVLTGIKISELLTLSHILDRATHPEIAEDLGNVLILSWTHHVAFDSGLWTFDESGRIWIRPELESGSPYLRASLIERHGEKVEDLAKVNSEYIEEHNEQLAWWPPG